VNKILTNVEAVILDMDGLILDTEASYFAAWKYALNEQGYLLDDKFCASLSGVSFSHLEALLTEHYGKINFTQFCDTSGKIWRQNAEQHGIAVKQGAAELLVMLKEHNIPYCLASNSAKKNVQECLEYAGLGDEFSLRVCGDEVNKPKPAGDIFLVAANRLDKPLEVCLIVEDSLIGLRAANHAGSTRTILVPSIFPVSDEAKNCATSIFANLMDFQKCLKMSLSAH